jgi:two-component system chemotaxis response regulator CheB
MPIKLLLADNSDIIRAAIVRLLNEETSVEVVCETRGFADTLRLSAALKPDILLLDLHMDDEDQYPPPLVREQLVQAVKCILAMSVWNDDKAHALAESLGAKVLLDKANLYSTLIPAIKHYCASVPRKSVRKPLRKLPSQHSKRITRSWPAPGCV